MVYNFVDFFRNEFCELMANRIIQEPVYSRKVCFSDEATFMLNGNVNRHNGHYWSQKNPHLLIENHTQNPIKLNVWAGIFDGKIVGPIFLDGKLLKQIIL